MSNPFLPNTGLGTTNSNKMNTRSKIYFKNLGATMGSTGNTLGFPSSNIGTNSNLTNRFSNGGNSNNSSIQPSISNYFPSTTNSTGRFTPSQGISPGVNSFNTNNSVAIANSNNSLGTNVYTTKNYSMANNNLKPPINSNPFLSGGSSDNTARIGYTSTISNSNNLNTAYSNSSLQTYNYSNLPYNPLNKKSEMDLPNIPPLTMPNGFDLNSHKLKLVNVKTSIDDISNAAFYRIPIMKDEDTKMNIKSHSISCLPDYMQFSHEELRYLNRIKKQSKPFDLNSNYCEITKMDKYSIFQKLSDPYVSVGFETADKNKYDEWFRKVSQTNQDDTFKGMTIQNNNFNSNNGTPGRLNMYGNFSTSNNTNNSSFFKPSNTLNTINNNNQITSNFNTNSNHFTTTANSSNPIAQTNGRYNFTNSTPSSLTTQPNVNNNYINNLGNNNPAPQRDYDLFNDKNNTTINNNTNRFSFNSNSFGGNNSNNFNFNAQILKTANTNNPLQSSANYGLKPSSTFSLNTNNNNFTTNTNEHFNPNNQINSQTNFHNNHFHPNPNNSTIFNNTQTNSTSRNGNVNFNFNNSHRSIQNDYTNFSNNNYNFNYNYSQINDLNTKDINSFLNNSIQNFLQYDEVINFLNDGKKENIYEKMVNRFFNNQFEDKREYKSNTKSLVVDLNQYKPNNYFIPSEITNPTDIKILKNIYAGKKVDIINTKKAENSSLPYKQSENTNINFTKPPKEKEVLSNKYDKYLNKNKERTNLKEKLEHIRTNQQVIETNRENPFLIPVFKELPVKYDCKKNIRKKEDDEITKYTQSNNLYKVIVEFDSPRNISFIYKTPNLLSIARLKSKLIIFLNSLPDFLEIEIKPNDIGFVIDGGMEMRDVGVHDLDRYSYSNVDNTPYSNFSSNNNNYFEKLNENKNLRVIKIKSMFTCNNDILKRYYEMKSRTGTNKVNEEKSNILSDGIRINANFNLIPIITKNYVLTPSIEEIQKMSEAEMKNIKKLTVESPFGKIVYLEPVDVTYTNFDAFIFKNNYFALDKSDRTSLMKFNKRAQVLLKDVFIKEERTEEDFVKNMDEIKEFCKTLNVYIIKNKLYLGSIYRL